MYGFVKVAKGGREASDRWSGAESFGGAQFCLGSFLFAIFRRGGGFERSQEATRDTGDFIDGGLKCRFVGLRGLVEAANLPYELERGGTNLVLADGRVEIE
jgi:hypothetical protein